MTAIDLDRELTGLRAEHADLLTKCDYLRRLGHAAGPEFDELLAQRKALTLLLPTLRLARLGDWLVPSGSEAIEALIYRTFTCIYLVRHLRRLHWCDCDPVTAQETPS